MKDEVINYLLNEEKVVSLKVAESLYAELERHPDILDEFEHWIKERKFPEENEGVVVSGYSAKKISETETIKWLHPIGVYNYLVYLREKPEEALEKIKEGFKIK